MFCQKCGAELSSITKFCVKCGHKLKTEPRISNKALLIVGAAALISVGAAGLSYWSGNASVGTTSTATVAMTASPSPTPTPQMAIVKTTPKPRPTKESEVEEAPTPTPRSTPEVYARAITSGPFVLNAGSYMFYQVKSVPGTSLRIEGWFEASGGGQNDIEVYILDEMGFTNYKNGNAAQTYYNSGRATTGKPHALLPLADQNYYVVFSNRFSILSSKSVRTYMTAWYSDIRRR